MFDFVIFLLIGVFLFYWFYVSWWKPEALKTFLANIYTDAWPGAKSFASSKFSFWLARIMSAIFLAVFILSIVLTNN